MIGSNIKTCRYRLGISQKELSEKLGVSASAVCNWEHDKRNPKITDLFMLAKILEVSVDELVFGRKE